MNTLDFIKRGLKCYVIYIVKTHLNMSSSLLVFFEKQRALFLFLKSAHLKMKTQSTAQ